MLIEKLNEIMKYFQSRKYEIIFLTCTLSCRFVLRKRAYYFRSENYVNCKGSNTQQNGNI